MAYVHECACDRTTAAVAVHQDCKSALHSQLPSTTLSKSYRIESMLRHSVLQEEGKTRIVVRTDPPARSSSASLFRSQAACNSTADCTTALFLHFSGCGGTTFVRYLKTLPFIFAPTSGVSSPNLNMGCAAGTGFQALGLANVKDTRCPCEDLWRRAAHYNFWANENVVRAPLDCEKVEYWLVIRHPIERLISRIFKPGAHGRWHFLQFDEMQAALNQTVAFPPSASRHEFTGSAALNNWMVRSIAGPDVYRLPLGSVEPDHLRRAERQLDHFAIVLPLPNMTLFPAMLFLRYGKCVQAFPPENAQTNGGHSASTETSRAQKERVIQNHEFMSALWRHNTLDLRLYESAQRLFRRRLWEGVGSLTPSQRRTAAACDSLAQALDARY